MAGKIDWNDHIGRRIKLRDLHVFAMVAHHRSMARAAAQLGVSQPAVSEVIATLEQSVQARLLERGPQGVELTIFGHVLLARSTAAFDELRQGIDELKFLSNPTAGTLRVGCADSLASAVLRPLFQKFAENYPRAVLHVDLLLTPDLELPRLRDRSLDIVVARLGNRPASGQASDLEIEILFHDHLVVCAGGRNPITRRRKLSAADLAQEPWALLPAGTWNTRQIVEYFRRHGLDSPNASICSFSFHLRANLVLNSAFLTGLPKSTIHYSRDIYPLKVLPLADWPIEPWPVGIISLKRRKLSPIAQLFIDELRIYTAGITAEIKTPLPAAAP